METALKAALSLMVLLKQGKMVFDFHGLPEFREFEIYWEFEIFYAQGLGGDPAPM